MSLRNVVVYIVVVGRRRKSGFSDALRIRDRIRRAATCRHCVGSFCAKLLCFTSFLEAIKAALKADEKQTFVAF